MKGVTLELPASVTELLLGPVQCHAWQVPRMVPGQVDGPAPVCCIYVCMSF